MSTIIIGEEVRSGREITQRFEYVLWKKVKKQERYLMLFFKYMEPDVYEFCEIKVSMFKSFGFDISKGKWKNVLNNLIAKKFIEREESINNVYRYRIDYVGFFNALDTDKGGWCYKEPKEETDIKQYMSYASWLLQESNNKREHMTPSEQRVDTFLRRHNIKYMSQAPIYIGERKGYILDFCVFSKNLAIEVDGSVHDTEEAKKKDAERTEELSKLGISVFRIKNEDTLSEASLYDKLNDVLGLDKRKEMPNCIVPCERRRIKGTYIGRIEDLC